MTAFALEPPKPKPLTWAGRNCPPLLGRVVLQRGLLHPRRAARHWLRRDAASFAQGLTLGHHPDTHILPKDVAIEPGRESICGFKRNLRIAFADFWAE